MRKVTIILLITILGLIVVVGIIAAVIFASLPTKPVAQDCDLGARGTDIQHSSDPQVRVNDAVSRYYLMKRCSGNGEAAFRANLTSDYAKHFRFNIDGVDTVTCKKDNASDQYTVSREEVSPREQTNNVRTVTRQYRFSDGTSSEVVYTVNVPTHGDALIAAVKCE